MKMFDYSVAIRTLGLSGNKFERELRSIYAQSIKPRKVIVYIAEGFSRPSFHVADEIYVTVKKGMVAQRALNYKEISSEYLLLLDDDVYLPPNAVEVLSREMERQEGDCIAADVFHPHHDSNLSKLYNFVVNYCTPRPDDGWAFKVKRSTAFSYNNNPKSKAYLSQSAAGPASLWRMNVLLAIHYHDEIWLDQMGFAFGDDQLMFQKVYKNGFRLLVSYDSGVIHLDAKSSSDIFRKSDLKFYNRAKAQYMIWFRSCYFLNNNKNIEKWRCALNYGIKLFVLFGIHLIYALCRLDIRIPFLFVKGNFHGYLESKRTLSKIPNFIIS